jgi:hypothetical protein
MRQVIESLERAGLAWYITGTEALTLYGSPGRRWMSTSSWTPRVQLRDCRSLLRMNRGRVDVAYVGEWARVLGVVQELRQAEEDAADAP